MRKTFTTFTVRLDTTTAKTLRSVARGYKGEFISELIKTNPKTVRRYTTKKAA